MPLLFSLHRKVQPCLSSKKNLQEMLYLGLLMMKVIANNDFLCKQNKSASLFPIAKNEHIHNVSKENTKSP